ncbi:putative Fe-containing alcohol dehydrogenase [Phyllosticta citricarpa]|uniref:Fe-containing alcohol dehydrogenase n=1 Tax=Phyllosticta citricarpa TaxID=55181 RepID=A0ABR1LRQ9_9PEZI
MSHAQVLNTPPTIPSKRKNKKTPDPFLDLASAPVPSPLPSPDETRDDSDHSESTLKKVCTLYLVTALEIITLPFEGQSHPVVSHGLPFEQACAKHVDRDFRASRVYVLASGTLARTTNVVRKLQEALGDDVVGVQDGMTPHTLWSECIEVTKVTKEANADLLITLGGESLIDAAKIVSLAFANNATDFPSILNLTNNHDPSVLRPDPASPTYSDHAGGTNDETHHKHVFYHAGAPLGPRPVVLDPELVTTTPQRFWLSSGARLQCQFGVVDAMAGCKVGAPLCASHGIGHQLGPLGVGHGGISCNLLPAVCAFNLSHAAEGVPGTGPDQQSVEPLVDIPAKQHIVLDVRLGLDVTAQLFHQHGLRQGETPLAKCLDVILRGLGMPRRLADFGVGVQEQLDKMAKNSLKDRWCLTNAVPLGSKEMVREILDSSSPKLV